MASSTVVGAENRSLVTTFTDSPIRATVAIDVQGGGLGTGILVGPNHVLTAGHNFYSSSTGTTSTNARITLSSAVGAIQDRFQGIAGNTNTTGTPLFPENYNTSGAPDDDIALVQLSSSLLQANQVMGLTAFVDPDQADNLAITTAGYPYDLPTVPTSANQFPNDVKSLYQASGSVADTTAARLYYTGTVDTASGQSGSGIWNTYTDETVPTVVGVHTRGYTSTSNPNRLNNGNIVTKDIYDDVVARMEADDGTANAADLPENIIVGSETFLFGLLFGDDDIEGSYRRERILGLDGDDTLTGGGADDRLEGGEDTDIAVYDGAFADYAVSVINDPSQRYEFSIAHTVSGGMNGTDRLLDVEFARFDSDFLVPLEVDPDDPTKLADGPLVTPKQDIVDSEGETIGSLSAEIPGWSFDGDVSYSFVIGSEQSNVYNFAYIIDVSGSMRGTKLTEAQNAYATLTQALIDSGVADNSTFGVIPFSGSASLYAPLDADAAQARIAGLSAGGSTEFGQPLALGQDFFANAPQGTNIAYFLSDGFGSGASASLQSLAEVRAFGIGNPDLASLDIIDSNAAVVLQDPADLITEFETGSIDPDIVDRVEVRRNGQLVETLSADQLTETTLGLTYEGVIDGLVVSPDDDNDIEIEAFFNDGTPSVEIASKIGNGQQEIVTQSSDGTSTVTFSINQSDYTSNLQNLVVNANDLGNEITVSEGENTLNGNGGDDVFVVGGGRNVIDGGAGTDLVRFTSTLAEAGPINTTGNVTTVGTDNTLIGIEFIEFADTTFDVAAGASVATLSLDADAISVTEGDSGSTVATFTVSADQVLTNDVTVAIAPAGGSADPATDVGLVPSSVVIAAGTQEASFDVEILGDTEVEPDEVLQLDLVAGSGAIFEGVAPATQAAVRIVADDTLIEQTVSAAGPNFDDGDPGPRTLTFQVDRYGDVDAVDTVRFVIAAAGDDPIDPSAFGGAFPEMEVTFEAGETSADVEVEFFGNHVATDDGRTFSTTLVPVSGDAEVTADPIVYTTNDDDLENPDIVAIFPGTDGDDSINGREFSDNVQGFGGNDVLEGLGGDDTIVGGDGNDTAVGGGGDDRVEGNEGDDELSGEGGNDGLLGGGGNDMLSGGSGDDTLAAADGDDTADGGDGDDFMGGGLGNDVLLGGVGNDTLGGGFGDDSLEAGDGDDVVAGGAGMDIVDGGLGSDTIGASFGHDSVTGGGGNDSLGGGTGQDSIDGGGGNDSIGGGEGDDVVLGGAGSDFVAGGGRNDTVDGGLGDDTINGGDGNDVIRGGLGADLFVWNESQAGAVDIIEDFENGSDLIFLTGVENAPGSGLQGRFDALSITDTTIGGVSGAALSYEGQTILMAGVAAENVTIDDLVFL